jgi:hypothetical protein
VVRLAAVDHVSGHDNCSVLAVDEAFDKVVVLALQNFALKNLKKFSYFLAPKSTSQF